MRKNSVPFVQTNKLFQKEGFCHAKVVAEAADAAVENAEVKEEVKAPKKAAAKKTKAKEPTVNFTVEYPDNNKTVAELTEFVKEAIKETYAANGNTEAIETIDIYYQPVNKKIWYAVNGKPQDTPVEF